MYRQLATLVNAGVPMVQALTTLANQTRNARLQSILNEAAQGVASGYPLSRTMERHPSVFTGIQLELIRAAETSGMLETMCNRIAHYLERELEIRRKLKKETLYPKIVLFVAGLVILLLGFLKSGADGFFGMVKFAATVGACGFGLWWLARYANQYPAVGAAWDNVKMLIPGAGGVARKYATARFTRALGALYGGGILLSNAVPIAARACGNRAIGQALLDKAYLLQQGQGLSGMLAASGLLSPIAVQMARTGEQTGSLDTMMDKVADYLEDEADAKSHQLAVGTGVAVLILAGLVVAYIAFSFYGGMFGSVMSEGSKE
jgi:type II secretory pathway component PulF